MVKKEVTTTNGTITNQQDKTQKPQSCLQIRGSTKIFTDISLTSSLRKYCKGHSKVMSGQMCEKKMKQIPSATKMFSNVIEMRSSFIPH